MLKIFLFLARSPIRILYASWGFVFTCYIFLPIEFDEAWSLATIFFVFGFFFLFSLSYILGKQFIVNLHYSLNKFSFNSSKDKRIDTYTKTKNLTARNFSFGHTSFKLDKFVTFIAFLGLIGSGLLAIDFLFLRGIDYSEGLSAAREVMQQTVTDRGGIPVGRPWSIIARALSGFVPVAALTSILYLEYLRSRTLFWVIVSLGFQIFTDVLSGGRNSIFMTLIFLVSGILIRTNRRNKTLGVNPQKIQKFGKLLLIFTFTFVVYALFIFIEREGLRGRMLVDAYTNMEMNWHLSFSFNISRFGDGENILHQIILACNYLCIYIVHGLNEINLLITQTPNLSPVYGLHSFYMPSLLANRLGFISSEVLLNASESIERSGVYFTALGSLYVDFGYWFSLVVFLALGFTTGICWKSFKLGYGLCFELICGYLLLSVITSPFYLSITTGNGFQVFSALIASVVVISIFSIKPGV